MLTNFIVKKKERKRKKERLTFSKSSWFCKVKLLPLTLCCVLTGEEDGVRSSLCCRVCWSGRRAPCYQQSEWGRVIHISADRLAKQRFIYLRGQHSRTLSPDSSFSSLPTPPLPSSSLGCSHALSVSAALSESLYSAARGGRLAHWVTTMLDNTYLICESMSSC